MLLGSMIMAAQRNTFVYFAKGSVRRGRHTEGETQSCRTTTTSCTRCARLAVYC